MADSRAQFNRDEESLAISKTGTFINFLVGISEVLAWVSLGHTLIAQIIFCAWAIAMVILRPYFALGAAGALARGQIEAAKSAQFWFKVAMFFTAFSLFSLFVDVMQHHAEAKRAEEPIVKLAQAKVTQAQKALNDLKAAHPQFTEGQAITALAEKAQLTAQLQTARANAQTQYAAQTNAVQQQIQTFWNRRHSSGITAQQIMDEQCHPKQSPYGGGLMKRASRELCPQLKALQAKIPQTANNAEVKRIQNKIDALQPILAYHLKWQEATATLEKAEANWLKHQSEQNLSNYLPPIFVKAAAALNVVGLNFVTPDMILWLFALIAIITVLHGQGFLKVQETIIRTPVPRDMPIPFQKLSLVKRLVSWWHNRHQTNAPVAMSQPVTVQQEQPVATQQEFIGFTPPGFSANHMQPGDRNEHQMQPVQPQSQGRYNLNVENYDRVVELYKQGKKGAAIARETGINKGTVYRYCKRYRESL
ncbi:MAG: hypothetical protein B6247_07755 [Candidatus Parabeggiatoa sp. nov. 2]|nr:MAG: hypothetical protein B6247_07755 [Beggiatoa sp. 4572_84]